VLWGGFCLVSNYLTPVFLAGYCHCSLAYAFRPIQIPEFILMFGLSVNVTA
jgi:hypothetical protein